MPRTKPTTGYRTRRSGRRKPEMPAPGTLILTAGDIAALMRPADYLAAAETAFRAAGEGRAHAPPPLTLEGAGGAFHAKAATLRLDRLYAALKLHGEFPPKPAERRPPAVQGPI